MVAITQGSRHISQLTRDTVSFILAGGRGYLLSPLTRHRAKSAIPFGGQYRLVDFTLSNCLNSGISTVGICTQYLARELSFHIQKRWGHMRGQFGDFVAVLPAEQGNPDHPHDWYLGTADAIYQNLDFVQETNRDLVLVLSGDHIYKMDYGPMLAQHIDNGADITLGVVQSPIEGASQFGVVQMSETGRIKAFDEKPEQPVADPHNPSRALVSMGIYIFSRGLLEDLLEADRKNPDSSHDFGHDVLPQAIRQLSVYGYRFEDSDSGVQRYWRDVGTIDAYYDANMDLVAIDPELNLYDNYWPIWAYREPAPGAKLIFETGRCGCGMATDSILSPGDIISGGRIRRSLLFTYVNVEKRSHVEDSLLLHRVNVGEDCYIRRAIIDEDCTIPDGTRIGVDPQQDSERFHVTPSGLVVITREMLNGTGSSGRFDGSTVSVNNAD